MSFDKNNRDINMNKQDDLKSSLSQEAPKDDMNIKSYLNTSFDLSGIVVSEDLIKRTLEAIKQTEADQQVANQPVAKQEEIKHRETKEQELQTALKSSKDNTGESEKSKKLIPWSKYVYRIAGVVAAALVVTVGINMINRKSMSYNDMSTPEKVAQDIVMNESTASDTGTVQNSTSYDENKADTAAEEAQADTTATSQFALESDANLVQKSSAKEEASGSTTADSLEDTAATFIGPEKGADITFRDIFLADPAQADYITIIDEINNNEIKLTDHKDISDFYSLMDQHRFTKGTGKISTQKYTIEVKSPQTEGITYSVIIGNGVIAYDNTGDTVIKTFYNSAEETALIKNLDDFFLKYSDN